MSFKNTLNQLIEAAELEFSFRDLPEADQFRLAAAYIRDDEDIIFDLFANVHQTSMAHHFACLAVSVESCDVLDMAQDIRNAIVLSGDLETLIDPEIMLAWRDHLRFRPFEEDAA